MEENGARLNRERLANAYLLIRSLAGRRGPERLEQSQIRRRAGTVQAAVIKALAGASGPLRAREIHSAAQILANEPLPWNTVKDCLHKNARRPGSPIERVSHGRYRIAERRVVRPPFCPVSIRAVEDQLAGSSVNPGAV